jgi:hypothetical protein
MRWCYSARMKHAFLALLLLLLAACANMKIVGQGIRQHALAGAWETPSGSHILIGCSGAFNADIVDGQWAIPGSHGGLTVPAESHESGSHIKAIDERGFVVSEWPFASQRYDVDEWPHLNPQGKAEMNMEGRIWTRTRDLACD